MRTEPGPPLLIHCRRFQVDLPIVARPVGWPERAMRWCRRNPAPALSVAAVTVTMCLGTVVSMTFAVAVRTEAGRAQENEIRATAARRKAQEGGHFTLLSRMSPFPVRRKRNLFVPESKVDCDRDDGSAVGAEESCGRQG
jgi:hypothetical protein